MKTKLNLCIKVSLCCSVLAGLSSCVGTVDRVEDRYDRREDRYDRRHYSGPGDHLENRVDRRENWNDKARGRQGLRY
ncbi:hypothetical protein [Verrucomicrobium sp. BvORR106]|uniref:hypothetical protein n=1 Tax=Verrucomicrobium sp. BvORR106 TaxID=1403819 RepID=UPI00056E81A3|nr:hypothetical protein [Verrucomicrobium sp. BvORR106]